MALVIAEFQKVVGACIGGGLPSGIHGTWTSKYIPPGDLVSTGMDMSDWTSNESAPWYGELFTPTSDLFCVALAGDGVLNRSSRLWLDDGVSAWDCTFSSLNRVFSVFTPVSEKTSSIRSWDGLEHFSGVSSTTLKLPGGPFSRILSSLGS